MHKTITFTFYHKDHHTLWIEVLLTDEMTMRDANDKAIVELETLVKNPRDWYAH